jgi:NAD(P)-dependent dehydrogenase (short-subunit alcohol dehydrogenase family)
MQGIVAIVTGGAGGIGRAPCEGLARPGAKLTLTDLNAAPAQRIAEAIHAADGQASAIDAAGILFDPDAV